MNLNRFLPNSLPTTLCVTSGRAEFTDDCISEWTCGGGGQVITTWSHSRSERKGRVEFTDDCISEWTCGGRVEFTDAASQNGHVEVVDKLLQHGATVDLQKRTGGVHCMLHLRMDMWRWWTSYYNMEPQ
ncbi:hypothetical protein GBAR_LOCUS347 [Geodia barretti]|uniref:Uncharacterized protein n=1 Tax=Geodia barretti TaxID=519541 RepID=A0AA35VXY1_GEOBA|nr:hypothetical protein GBAR_LOCUS347 [Geodia barretti]